MKSQVQGVLREDQVFRHQVVAVHKLRLLLAQSRYQARFFFQTWNEKRLCVKSRPAALVRRGLERAPAEDTKRLLAMLGSSLAAPLTLSSAHTERALLGAVRSRGDPLSHSLAPLRFGHTFHMYILTPPLLFVQLLQGTVGGVEG